MASTAESASGDNTSTGGCTTPNSNPNYDSDSRSDLMDENQVQVSVAVPVHESVAHMCSVCLQPFYNPRVLDCFHTFCLDCISTSMMSGVEVACKICKRITKLDSPGGASSLKVDTGRMRYVESLTFNTDDNLICRCCNQNNQAVARCRECSTFLCNMCQQQHMTMHCYVNHQVINLHDRFERPSPDTLVCMEHMDQQPHAAVLYCYHCHHSCCEETQHQYLNPSHRVVNLQDLNFEETLYSLKIERERAQTMRHLYDNGMARLKQCRDVSIEEIQKHAQTMYTLIRRWEEQMKDNVRQLAEETRDQANTFCRKYGELFQSLDALIQFLGVQSKHGLMTDNVQMKPFVEKSLRNVNNSKPDTNNTRLIFDFTFNAKNPLHNMADLGCLSNIPMADPQIQTRQPAPIQRPRTTPNFGTTSSYQNVNSVSGFNNYRQYNQQPEAYRSSTSGQSNDANQMGYFGFEQRSQQKNSYDASFPGQSSYPRSSSSPMTVSQPNSASMVNDNVFDFNNLQPERTTDGTNRNYTNTYSAAHNPDRSYKTWSNGIDQPGSAGMPPQLDDIFTHSDYFESPTTSGSTPEKEKTISHIARKKMQFVHKFGEYGNSQGQFTEPSGVAVDSEGRLVVADTNNSRIQVFDHLGQFQSQYSNLHGAKLTYPNRIAISKVTGRVVVTERAPSHRVQTYTSGGVHLNTFGEEILQHPRGVAVDMDDNIIVIECKVMRVTIFTMEGQLLDQFSLSKDLQFPNSVAVNSKQEIFLCDNRDHCIKVFSYKGYLLRRIGREGITCYPIAVAINQRGHVVVADNHTNFNITVFDQQGQLLEAYESKTKHAQCFDMALTDDGLAILTSKDYKVYCYPYQEDSPHHPHNQRR
ncbi:hypothetical protein ACOMHN_057961 [Nucella lapillus]